ncbi:MAG: ATP-binding protein [Bdellovibrionales bacterium]
MRINFIITLIFCAIGFLTLQLNTNMNVPIAVWPGGGLLLGAGIYFGYRILWSAFFGGFLTAILYIIFSRNIIPTPDQIVVSILPAFYFAMQTATGIYLVRRFLGERNYFKTELSILKFFTIVGIVSSVPNYFAAQFSLGYFIQDQGVITAASFKFWIAAILGNITFTPLTLIVLDKKIRNWSPRVSQLIASLLIVFIAIGTLVYTVEKRQAEKAAHKLSKKQDRTIQFITAHMDRVNFLINSLGSFYESHDKISKEKFHNFSQLLSFDLDGVKSINWFSEVHKSNKNKLEKHFSRKYNLSDLVLTYSMSKSKMKLGMTLQELIKNNAEAVNELFKASSDEKIGHLILKDSSNHDGNILTLSKFDSKNKLVDDFNSQNGMFLVQSDLNILVKDVLIQFKKFDHKILAEMRSDFSNSWHKIFEVSHIGSSELSGASLDPTFLEVNGMKLKATLTPHVFYYFNEFTFSYWLLCLGIIAISLLFNAFILIFSVKAKKMNLALNQLEWEISLRRDTEDKITVMNIKLEEELLRQSIEISESGDKYTVAAKNSQLAALGEMAGGIAHELNNPLAIIDGYAYNIRRMAEMGQLDTDKVKSIAANIEKTVKRIAKIIKGLRKVSRDGSKDEIELILVSEFLSDTLAFCQERFFSHGIKLQIEDFDENLEINCRSVELSQVFINLLNNSFHAVQSESEKWIRIYVKSTEQFLEFAIEDSGPGIPKESQSKIMDPFFTTKAAGVGTGLGLSISKGIVNSHQGQLYLDVNSKYTRFVIKIPHKPIQSLNNKSVA